MCVCAQIDDVVCLRIFVSTDGLFLIHVNVNHYLRSFCCCVSTDGYASFVFETRHSMSSHIIRCCHAQLINIIFHSLLSSVIRCCHSSIHHSSSFVAVMRHLAVFLLIIGCCYSSLFCCLWLVVIRSLSSFSLIPCRRLFFHPFLTFIRLIRSRYL